MARVAFDWVYWSVRYPELAKWVPENLATIYWNEAGMYCDNTDCSPFTDLENRKIYLGMVTAHIAKLNGAINGQDPTPLVGRISQATQGTVTVQATMTTASGAEDWYAQTQYGIAFWNATSQFRSFQYVPGPVYVADPWTPIIGPYPYYQ